MAKTKGKKGKKLVRNGGKPQTHFRYEMTETSALDLYLGEYRGDAGITIQRMWRKRGQEEWQHGKRTFIPFTSGVDGEELTAAEWLAFASASLVAAHLEG